MLLAACLCLTAFGCGTGIENHLAANLALQLSPSATAASVGDRVQFVPSGLPGFDASACQWTVSTDATQGRAVLSALTAGSFLADSAGDSTVTASCAGQSAEAHVSVSALPPSGPLLITHGGTYTGNFVSTDPSVPAVAIRTSDPVVLQNSSVTGPGNLIMVYGGTLGTHLTVRNVTGTALPPLVAGSRRGMFLYVEGINSLDVIHNVMIGVSMGIVTAHGVANHLTIVGNRAENMDDRAADGKGGMSDQRATLGHFLLLDHTIAPNGAEIAWNQCIDLPGQSSVEDIINIYSAQGGSTAAPIRIHDNYLQGALSYPGASYSGGGITIDGDPSQASTAAYISVTGNHVVSTQNNGIFIANGHDIVVTGNRVVSSGITSAGVWLEVPGTDSYGYMMQNYYASQWYFNNSMTGNYSAYVRRSATSEPVRADYSLPAVSAALGNVASSNTASSNSAATPTASAAVVTPASEAAEYALWLKSLNQNSVTVGLQ